MKLGTSLSHPIVPSCSCIALQTKADPVWPFVRLLHGRVAVEDLEHMSEQHWSIVAKTAHSPIPDEAVRTLTIRRTRELGAQASELLGA